MLRIGGAKYRSYDCCGKEKRGTLYEANKTKRSDRRSRHRSKVKGIMYKVTSIAPRAFKGNKKVTSVTIAGSISESERGHRITARILKKSSYAQKD